MKRIFFLLILFLITAACSQSERTILSVKDLTLKNTDVQAKQDFPANPKITLSAIGDILIHTPVYRDAQTSGGYDFTPMFKNVAPYLKNTTISIANQETMIGGTDFGLSGYPAFNSPREVGTALKTSGIDVVSIANNHTLDRGEKAIEQAISHWNAIDMTYTGAFKSQPDQNDLRVIRTSVGIDVAFLSYTYGTNGIPVPENKDYLVNLIDEQAIRSEVKQANQVADAVVVSMHFGEEYQRIPNDYQKKLAQLISDAGAHVILGHHPHVLQPIEMLQGKNGNETLVIYSLGNFLSAQEETYRRIGGILQVELEKDRKDGSVSINQPAFIPTIVDYTPFANHHAGTDFKVVPMHSSLQEEVIPEQKKVFEDIKHHMSQWLPELRFPSL
ncbi:poly-gamma-glutamate synthesis protein (capsule biosynthesis protein) [Thalassobacillus cyri]|uniref:Poly-gamma-glutamate synthesis protein (Capsule biosynthesis protein) n=1 Tax=Thalassobacillus cyri TaxID=571932 RepID=A0A1H3Y2S5_9BACI|nr:CapA family protein [Thalassobacillus cyri]SEA06027.1 poly-gamma-glutamate synthesis protein (capsule biosynthesis protein) [Thalassobacillus cyri]